MTKKLVIVESPSKSKTIEKYLGGDYKVVSSLGHIRDLATTGKYGFGIDLENEFQPNYIFHKKYYINSSYLKYFTPLSKIFRSCSP